MTIARVTARWTGFPGAPGYSNFYFEVASNQEAIQGRPQLVADFFNAFSSRIPRGVTISIEDEMALIDEIAGVTLSYETLEEIPEDIEGSSAPNNNLYAGPAGAVVTWTTAGVRNGRRVQGRTFLVPLNINTFASDGTLTSDALDEIRAGASILSAEESGMVVWSRPNGGDGQVYPINGHRVPDLAAVLRSRRD